MQSNETQTTVPLPIHSKVSVVERTENQPGRIDITLAAPSEIKSVTRSDSITTPTSHVPPSPSDFAKAKGVYLFYILGALSLLAAGLLAWRGHGKAAGFCALGAFLSPTLGNLVSREVGIRATLVIFAISLTLFAAWHLMKKRLTTENQFTVKP